MKKAKKIILVFLLVLVFLSSVNFGIFVKISEAQIASTGTRGISAGAAGATSCALGAALAAVWSAGGATVDIRKCIDEIMLAVWKAAVFPLLKKTVISLVTKGDFGITWQGIQDWFWYDLVFQTAEEILKRIGFSLCAQFSLQIKLALFQSLAPDYSPECTFKESELAQIVDDAINKGTDTAWARLRRDFWGMFYLSSLPPNNQFTNYWMAKSLIYKDVSKTQYNIEKELEFNMGFLGTRDCEDKNKDGKIDNPTKCRVVTPGRWFAETVFGEYSNIEKAGLGAQVTADLAALTAMALDLIVNQTVSGLYQDLQNWVRDNKEDAYRDYVKSLEKQVNQNQSPIGENKAIEFPHKESTYEITPSQVSPFPSAPKEELTPLIEEPGKVQP